MKARQIKNSILPLSQGSHLHGTIDAPIALWNGSAITRIVDFQNGEKAVTHYERLAVHAKRSLLALRLDAGRTHQIRVHMKYLGFPLAWRLLIQSGLPDHPQTAAPLLSARNPPILLPVFPFDIYSTCSTGLCVCLCKGTAMTILIQSPGPAGWIIYSFS